MENINREQLQDKAINDIAIEYYDPKNIFCAEYPTGSGKTKILLEAAEKIQKNTGKSVIISTSNNALVLAFLNEANKHGIDENNICVVIGKNNYVDKEKVMDESFINLSGITKENAEDYLNNNGEVLSYDFINHFNIMPEYEELIQQDDDSIYTNLDERREQLVKESKIYITNHYYLISLYRFLKDEHDFTSLPILIDEAHELHQAAEAIFSISFSPYRLSAYINSLIRAVNDTNIISNKDKKLLYAVKDNADKLKNFFVNKKEQNQYEHEFIKEVKQFNDSNGIKELKKILSILAKKRKIDLKVKKIITILTKELYELDSLKYKSDNMIGVFITPIKKYPTLQFATEDASFILRNFMWKKNRGYITLISGTFCISESTKKEDNIWSFMRLGLFNFLETENDNIKLSWNDRIKLNLIFKTEKPIFSSNQAKCYIAEEQRFLPPSHKVKNDLEKLTKAWIDAIADEVANKLLYKNTVILMSSFENCEALNNSLQRYEPVKDNYKIFFSSPNYTIKQLQNNYMAAIDEGHNCILIGNLSFYTGIDLPHNYLNTLLIGKLPFEPNKKYLTRLKVANSISQQLNNRFKAILLFRQGLGRGLRSETDRVFIGILDPRILKARYKPFLYFLERMSQRIFEVDDKSKKTVKSYIKILATNVFRYLTTK